MADALDGIEPVDLGLLDPRRDPHRFDQLIGSILAKTDLEGYGRLNGIGHRVRFYTVVSAAVASIAVVVMLLRGTRPIHWTEQNVSSADEIAGMPVHLLVWAAADRHPTPAEWLHTYDRMAFNSFRHRPGEGAAR